MHSLPASQATIAEATKLIDQGQATIDTALRNFQTVLDRLAAELEASKKQLKAVEDKMQREVRELMETLRAAVFWADGAPGREGTAAALVNMDVTTAELEALHDAMFKAEDEERRAREASVRAEEGLRECRRLGAGMGF